MKCTNCGAELEEGAKVCASCSTAVAEETPDAAPAEKKGVLAEMIDICKDMVKKADEFVASVFGNKKMYAYAGALGLLALILVVVAIVGLIPKTNGYLTVEHSQLVPYDETLYLLTEGKLKDIKISADSFSDYEASIDYEKFVVLSGDDELFSIKGTKAKKIAEDVSDFTLSLYGDAVVYKYVDGLIATYYYCKTNSDKSTEIFETGEDGILSGFVITPDGKGVAYTVVDGEDIDLYYFNGKKSVKRCSVNGNVIGVSNGGKYIYVAELGENGKTLSVVNKKGEKEKINSASGSTFAFNLDATEIMFYDDGRTYISIKGKEPQRVAGKELSLLSPKYTNTFEWNNSAKICPVETLYNHVYTGDGAVYYVSKNENKNTKIINGASSVTLDDSAKYVYYKDDGDLMCAKISHGADAKGKAKLIAEDAGAYVVTSDRKYVYYIEDDSLYAVNGKKGGKAKMISNDDVSSGITISNKDVVYYTSDGDVYAAKGRSKGKKVLEDASFNRFGGYVYISDDDVLYAARGTSKPKKLLDRE